MKKVDLTDTRAITTVVPDSPIRPLGADWRSVFVAEYFFAALGGYE